MSENTSLRSSLNPAQLRADFRTGNFFALDVCLGLLLALFSAALMSVQAIGEGLPREIEALYWIWGAAYFLPFTIRRTSPDLAFALTVIPHLFQLFLIHEPTFGNLMVPIMVYTVSVRSPRKLWLWVSQVAALLGGIRFMWTLNARYWEDEDTVHRIPASDYSFLDHLGAFFNNYLLCFLVVTSAWTLGRLLVNRKEAQVADRERLLAVGRERDQFQQLAAEQERSAIARDMHDIVAHSLAVIVVQTDGARYLLEQQPEVNPQVIEAVSTVGDTARDALRETRRLVGVLRSSGEEAERAPAVALDQIPDLVETMSRAGLQVSYQRAGSESLHAPLPMSAQTALYRVAQEGLTNVVKHAGANARCLVRVTHLPDGVQLAIVDDGMGGHPFSRPGLPTTGGGHGIIGMRERMSAFGGQLIARERMGGGFEVLAFLPAPNAAQTQRGRGSTSSKGRFA